MPHYEYSAGHDEIDHGEFCRFDFPDDQKLYGEDWVLVADELAEDYHGNHDGWEASWPLELRIYKDGSEVARFNVHQEHQPVFYAYGIDVPQMEASAKPAGIGGAWTPGYYD
ncbi:hypothetical protein ACWIGM_09080 [Bosea sp. NPDC055332]